MSDFKPRTEPLDAVGHPPTGDTSKGPSTALKTPSGDILNVVWDDIQWILTRKGSNLAYCTTKKVLIRSAREKGGVEDVSPLDSFPDRHPGFMAYFRERMGA